MLPKTVEHSDGAKNANLPRPLLIVEDDEAIEFALSDLVTDSGYRTVGARNGIEALEVLRREKPLAMIIDLMMPHMDGYELIRNVRGDPGLADVPMLVVTARSFIDREGLAGVPVFTKPLNTPALMEAIRVSVGKGT
jgi:CheY-like chemotaxis protein